FVDALAGDLREKLSIGGPDAEEMLILHGDSSRDQTLGMLGRELLVELSIPAQLRQFHSRVLFGPFITSEKISNRVAFLYFWQERLRGWPTRYCYNAKAIHHIEVHVLTTVRCSSYILKANGH